MTKEMGLWIDHQRAVIVTSLDAEEAIKQVKSNMEKRVRYSVSRPGGGNKPHQVSSENGRDRRMDNQLDQYYDEIIAQLTDVTSILILGPGEAKIEFQKRLEGHAIPDLVVSVKTTDKLTDAQIAAEVRQHFQPV